MSKEQMPYDIVRPDPASLLQSIRSFGYTVETAIADLIDNSITAGATNVKISYGIDNHTSYVRIEDNGKGMAEDELVNAMKIGSYNPLDLRSPSDLGRFGLGLKTASFSQCTRLTVKTRDRSGRSFIRCWDLDLVRQKQDWVLLRDCIDKYSRTNLDDFSSPGTATIVLWEKMDRLVETFDMQTSKDHFYRKFDYVRKHLGIIFHRFIEDGQISISIPDGEIAAVNPFNISDKFPSTELQESKFSINEQEISIQPFILPHESKLGHTERNRLELVKGWTEHQGIYLYRNKRLILDGSWLDLDFRKKESQRLCRIKIDIPNTLDKEWQIDVRKNSSKIPDIIRKNVKNICLAAIDKAVKVYTHRGSYIRREGDKKEIVYLWRAKQKKGKRYFEVNTEHPVYKLIADRLKDDASIFNDFIKLIGESLPVNLIVTEFGDPSTTFKDYFENSKDELIAIRQNIIDTLISKGLTEKEAIEKVKSMDSFQPLNHK